MSLRRCVWGWWFAVLAVAIVGGNAAAEKMSTFDAGGFRLPAFAVAPDTGVVAWVNVERLGPAELTQSFTAIRDALPESVRRQLGDPTKEIFAGMLVYGQVHARAQRAGARGLVLGVRALNPTTMAYQPPVYAMLHTTPEATLEGIAAATKFSPDASVDDPFADAYRLCPGWFAVGTGQLAEPPVRQASNPHARMFAGVLKREADATAVVVVRPNTLLAPLADMIPMLAQQEPGLLESWEQVQQMKGMVMTLRLGDRPEIAVACHFKSEAAAEAILADFTANGVSDLISGTAQAGVALDPARVDAAMAELRPVRDGKTVTYRFGLDALAAWAPLFAEAQPASTAVAPSHTRNPFRR
ncbi:MAG: hypothetical protein AAGE65_08750 [Planctomycetota bacterium]